MTERKDIDGALRHIERIREATTRDYERAMRKLDNDERDLLGLKRDDDEQAEGGKNG
jgi:hypothetical protein